MKKYFQEAMEKFGELNCAHDCIKLEELIITDFVIIYVKHKINLFFSRYMMFL